MSLHLNSSSKRISGSWYLYNEYLSSITDLEPCSSSLILYSVISQIDDAYLIESIILSSNNLSVQSYHNSKKKTLSTLAGRLMSDDGFTNSLFFIFLAGLSTGVVFMIILNFFMK